MAAVKEGTGNFENVITLSSSDEESSNNLQPKTMDSSSNGAAYTHLRDCPGTSGTHPNHQNHSAETVADMEEEQSNCKADAIVEKFVSTLLPLMEKEAEKKIIQSIYKIKDNCRQSYLDSCDFEELITSTLTNIENNKKNIFIYIKNTFDEMKAYAVSRKSKPVSENSKHSEPKVAGSASEAACSEEAHERHIRKLDRLLRKLDRKIRRLKRKEITLEEMDDNNSAYIYEDKLCKKFMQVWKKLCELKKRAPTLGNNLEKKLKYRGDRGSRYPELDKKVEDLVNSTRQFPDFGDILKLTRSVNEESVLGLTETRIQKLAEEVFEDVGRILKNRREQDFQDLFGCYLTDDLQDNVDPAETDGELKAVLDESYKMGVEKLNSVLSKYTEMQTTLKLEPQEVPDEEANRISGGESDDDEDDRAEEQDQIEEEMDSTDAKLETSLQEEILKDDSDDEIKSQPSSVDSYEVSGRKDNIDILESVNEDLTKSISTESADNQQRSDSPLPAKISPQKSCFARLKLAESISNHKDSEDAIPPAKRLCLENRTKVSSEDDCIVLD